MHKKAEDIFDHIPRDALTIEYGGNNGYQAEGVEAWESKLLAYSKYFEDDANYGTDEKLRIGLAHNWESENLGGIDGSFRKLEVD